MVSPEYEYVSESYKEGEARERRVHGVSPKAGRLLHLLLLALQMALATLCLRGFCPPTVLVLRESIRAR